MKKFIIERSEDEFYTSHSGLALVGLGVNRFTKLSGRLKRTMPDTKTISNIDVIRSYIGLLALGKSDYEAITDMRDDRFFHESMGLKSIPSAETLRQRLDEIAKDAQPLVSSTFTEFIQRAKGKVTPLASGHVPLDIDVFCMDNSGTKKEGVAYTYHGYHGYVRADCRLSGRGRLVPQPGVPGRQPAQPEELRPVFGRISGAGRRADQKAATAQARFRPRCH